MRDRFGSEAASELKITNGGLRPIADIRKHCANRFINFGRIIYLEFSLTIDFKQVIEYQLSNFLPDRKNPERLFKKNPCKISGVSDNYSYQGVNHIILLSSA